MPLKSRLRPGAAAVVASLSLLVAGCGAAAGGTPESPGQPAAAGPTGGATRAFEADNGTITIPAKPQRIVATGYAVPVLLESQAPLVGISAWSRGENLMSPEVKAEYDATPRVAGNLAAETNYEAIATAKPDLIVISVPRPVVAEIDVKRLESIAPVVVIAPTKPDAWKTLSARQLDAAGRQQDLAASKAAYEKRAGELKKKYAKALSGMTFGHVGGYGEIARGQFHREFAGSWGTNIAGDIGVVYDGTVKEAKGNASDSSEYLSLEELPRSLGTQKAITYTADPDGTAPAPVRSVLDHPLWAGLPAVKAGKVFPVKHTAAASYGAAMRTLDGLDQALAPLLSAAT